MSDAFFLFHLNLAYSSIGEDQRPEVVRRCYWPLLDLAQRREIKPGIELTGWTLERIAEIDPAWVARFVELLAMGRCELIGSGYTQMIGPLTPFEVNDWNQALGLAAYQRILGRRPRLVLVNEMAYSSAMVGLYRQAGYEGMVMDRDNICLARNLAAADALPRWAKGLEDEDVLPVLWSDSIMFQKLQHYAHGDIRLVDYQRHFQRRVKKCRAPLSIYSNDAEVFDYRPGRFGEEGEPHPAGEWRRIEKVIDLLDSEEGVGWLSPYEALQCGQQLSDNAQPLSSAHAPIPVKKQAKYNVSRWAVSGRDDLRMNTLCHRIYRSMAQGDPTLSQRQALCELWASDLRTHIGIDRWQMAQRSMQQLLRAVGASAQFGGGLGGCGEAVVDFDQLLQAGFQVSVDEEGIFLHCQSEWLVLTLNLRRGLAVERLAFRRHDFTALVGTLPHGYFHSIELGADFYSGGVVVELLTEHRRVTDLERVEPSFHLYRGRLHIRAQVVTPKGVIEKEVVMAAQGEAVEFGVAFPQWSRPYGTVRIGALTWLPRAGAERLSLTTNTGGPVDELFQVDEPCQHTQPASSLVSCTTGLGGVGGEVVMAGRRALRVSWDPAQAAAFPMLYHVPSQPAALTRLIFSLCEVDETFREGGVLPPFRYRLSPV